jgi:hypothetical protein
LFFDQRIPAAAVWAFAQPLRRLKTAALATEMRPNSHRHVEVLSNETDVPEESLGWAPRIAHQSQIIVRDMCRLLLIFRAQSNAGAEKVRLSKRN